MAEAARGKSRALDLEPFAEAILRPDPDVHRALHETILARYAQAALRAVLLAGGLDYLGVNELDNVFVLALGNVGFEHEHRTAQYADLRRCKADAVCLGKRVRHIVEQLMQPRVKVCHRAALFVQRRIALCKYMSECHSVLQLNI